MDVKASRKDQLITVERGATLRNSRIKREKQVNPITAKFSFSTNETSAPSYILNALIRRSEYIRGDEPTAFPTNALDENRLTSPGDLVANCYGALSLIIYRTTDRSTPCWIIRGSSVQWDRRWGRRLSRTAMTNSFEVRVPFRSCASASTEAFESARTHTRVRNDVTMMRRRRNVCAWRHGEKQLANVHRRRVARHWRRDANNAECRVPGRDRDASAHARSDAVDRSAMLRCNICDCKMRVIYFFN